MDRAKEHGCGFVVFPELALTTFFPRWYMEDQAEIDAFAATTRHGGIVEAVRPLATTHSPAFLGLFDADNGLRSVEGLDGDGIVIGVIDSGVTPEHPALQDTREADRPSTCSSRSWAFELRSKRPTQASRSSPPVCGHSTTCLQCG